MKQLKYIGEYTEEELQEKNVFLCRNDDGYLCILIKNELNKQVPASFHTDNLEIKLNSILINNNKEFYFHIINSKNNDYYGKIQFEIIFDYLFSKLLNPIKDYELSSLITSLEDYFKTTPDNDYRNLQIGVFGELLVIKKLFQFGYVDIVNKYHNNFYSKHDVEINSNIRLEIKTTSTENRIHKFKHDQISRDDISVYVASSIIEPTAEGLSLYDLFVEIISYFVDPDMIFALRKLMLKCNISEENTGLKVSFEKAYNNIKFYSANQLPQLVCKIPEGVSSISYNVDCNCSSDVNIEDLINIFNGDK